MTETSKSASERSETLDPQTATIRALNDHLRRTFSGGRVVMTRGVQALSDTTIARVLTAISQFDEFNDDNDPYHTHEFGAVDVDGERVFFKLDAYDENMEYGSPNPADPRVTQRVLTILLASEY